MWTKLSHFILKHRLWLIIAIALVTVFMAFQARSIKWSFDLASIVPSSDPEMKFFQAFKKQYGEDGNILAIGMQDSAIFEVENFTRFKYLSDEIAKVKGVNNVLSLPLLQRLEKNQEKKKFEVTSFFGDIPDRQVELDSMLSLALDQKFYAGQIINKDNGATILLISVEKEVLNTKDRDRLVGDISFLAEAFEEHTGIELHYAGLPYTRSVITEKIKNELNIFLVLSFLVTAIVLLVFFRSATAVLVPMLIIGVIVIWSMGTLALLDYKITILTGLIPPIIVVIGIPNSVYLINKYHQEYNRHGNKTMALSRVIRKIGLVTLITNFTTAVGFLVLVFTDIQILREFGIVAGLNILGAFVVSIILIPSAFSYLPPPSSRHLKHLKFKLLNGMLNSIDYAVHNHRYAIFAGSIAVIVISFFGFQKLESVSFLVDDIPEESKVQKDMRFFEKNFGGIMPLEIVVDTGNKRGATRLPNLQKIDEFERFLEQQENISKPVSIVSFTKAARQAYYNNNPAFYDLPNSRDQAFVFSYLKDQEDPSGLLNSFVDSLGQSLRISLKVADIGSNKMDSLVSLVISPEIERIFGDTKMEVSITGTTPLFIKGNRFLIENLRNSLLIAFGIISLIMGLLFRNFKMILISIIPNMIPLLITAGIMGYFGIALKPSTALIFSIAFGISVDDSIHFLAKYRQELFANNFHVPKALSISIKETGASMMYTSIILFFGFVIFAYSEFGGTVALGVLTSITLMIAMFTNLLLLPALLYTFDDGKRKKDSHPLIEQYDDEFYLAADDEAIDINLLKIKDNGNEEESGESKKEHPDSKK